MKNSLLYILIISMLFTLTTFGQIRVLEADGSKNQNVTVQNFYPVYSPQNPQVLSNKFTLDMWIKVANGYDFGYALSDGYGGTHAILFGFVRDPNTGLYALTGNIRSKIGENQFTSYNFFSPPIITANKWHNYGLELNENVITCFVDGIPISQNPFAGERISGVGETFDESAGTLYFFGSDHINLSGKIAQVRLIEGHAVYKGQGYVVQPSYRDSVRIVGTNTDVDANLLLDLTKEGLIINDLSNGYRGKRHNGSLRNASNGLFFQANGGELPKFVQDSEFPSLGQQSNEIFVPETPPPNAIIFDSFNRGDQNTVTQSPTLGVTEVGGRNWTVQPYQPFFIQFENAVYSGFNYYVSALVDSGLSDGKLSVTKINGYETGIRFRSTDFANGYAAFTISNTLYLDKLVNGLITERKVATFSSCSSLIAEYRDEDIIVTCGDASISMIEKSFGLAKKVGLYAHFPTDKNRFDNFTLLP